MTTKNIFENIEKVSNQNSTPVPSIEEDAGLLLIITYKKDEQELFYMKREAAIKAVEEIHRRLNENEIPSTIILHNKKQKNKGLQIKQNEVKEFRSIVVLRNDIRTVRLVDPNEIQDND